MKKSMRRTFAERDDLDRDRLIADSWCDYCEKADLGLEEPCEYVINGTIFLEGRCVQCGHDVVSIIEECPR